MISYENYRAKLSVYLSKNHTIARPPRVSWSHRLYDILFPYNRSSIVITSDGKINIFYLLFVTGNQIIILNGLGSYEGNKLIRKIFIKANLFKKNITICCQSYRDFRYIKRYSSVNVKWVPGSGGIKRLRGKSSIPLFITRERKLDKMKSEIMDATNYFDKINVVGVSKKDKFYKFSKLNFLGQKHQREIFKDSSVFLQIDGYGEGIPHSLADAICSNMDIIIHRRCWVKFGFYNIIQGLAKPEFLNDKFYYIRSQSEAHAKLKSELQEKNIFSKIEEQIKIFQFNTKLLDG